MVTLFGLIAVEQLNIKGMAAGMLAKSVNDAGWGSFIAKLTYKAAEAGRELVKVPAMGRRSDACVERRIRRHWAKDGITARVADCRFHAITRLL